MFDEIWPRQTISSFSKLAIISNGQFVNTYSSFAWLKLHDLAFAHAHESIDLGVQKMQPFISLKQIVRLVYLILQLFALCICCYFKIVRLIVQFVNLFF